MPFSDSGNKQAKRCKGQEVQLKSRNEEFQGRDRTSDWKRHKTRDGRRSRGQEIQRTSKQNRKKGGEGGSEFSPLPQAQFSVHEWFGVMTLNGCNK